VISRRCINAVRDFVWERYSEEQRCAHALSERDMWRSDGRFLVSLSELKKDGTTGNL
jgi:hypothetical protein